MAFTYTADLSEPRDYVRFLLGDTIEGRAFLDDGEIESALLLKGNNVFKSAHLCAKNILAQMLRQGSFRSGSTEKSRAESLKYWREHINYLSELAAASIDGFIPDELITINQQTLAAMRDDTTVGQPFFRRDQMSDASIFHDELEADDT